jgi:hypothetical protein
MLLLLACSREPPPIPCAVTPAMVGVPEGRIESCDPLPAFPEVVQVRIGGKGHTVVLAGGVPVAERGGSALKAWLDALGARRGTLDMRTLVAVLRALEAFPPRFDATSVGFDMPALGKSSFVADPFALVLVTGAPPEEVVFRATLQPDPWQWTIESRTPSTEWKEEGVLTL